MSLVLRWVPFLVTLLTFLQIQAAEQNEEVEAKTTTLHVSTPLPTINESWYILFDSALGNNQFSGKYGDFKEDLSRFGDKDSDTSMNSSIGLALGVYIPFNNHKTMIGPYMAGSFSSEEYDNNNHQSYEVNDRILELAASLQHYFGQNIGHGFFLRSDLGISQVTTEVRKTSFCFFDCDERSDIRFRDGTVWSMENYGDSRKKTVTSAYGLVGGGFAFRLGRQMRMQVSLNHALRPTSEGNLSTTSLILGMLF